MPVRMRLERTGSVTVVTLSGVAGAKNDEISRALSWRSGSSTRGQGDALIADLSDLTLIDPAAVEELVAQLAERPEPLLAIVCRRATGRRLLRLWRIDDAAPVYASSEAALTASQLSA